MAGCCLECGLVALWLLPTVEVLRPACQPAGGPGQVPRGGRPPAHLACSAAFWREIRWSSLTLSSPPALCPALLHWQPAAFPGWRNAALGWPGPRLPFNDWTECPASHTLSSSEADIPLQSHPPRLAHTALILACSGFIWQMICPTIWGSVHR